LMVNEVITPRMTVFGLSLDVDDKELVKTFYSTSKADTWADREEVCATMKQSMADFVQLLSTPDTPDLTQFSVYNFESVPDTNKHAKVGLRFIFRFKNLAFKDTEVVSNFIKAFRFFLMRSLKSVGNSIDEEIYSGTTGHLLRLPMMGKDILPNGRLSRMLIPLFTEFTASFRPTLGLVHMKQPKFREEEAVVLSSIGNISDLVSKYSPKEAEFKLLKNKLHHSGNNSGGVGVDHLSKNYCSYFKSIADTVIVPAILSKESGGGYGLKPGVFTRVTRIKHARYLLEPSVNWCSVKNHSNPSGKPCRYFVNILPGNKFSLGMYCFSSGCRCDKDIYVGDLPS